MKSIFSWLLISLVGTTTRSIIDRQVWQQYLLFNCTKQSTIMREQSTNILRYCTAIWKFGYLDSWLFGQLVILYCKKTLFDQSAERATFLFSLCFSRLMRNEQRDLAEKSIWRMNNLLVFCLTLRARQNTAQLVKILSDTTH